MKNLNYFLHFFKTSYRRYLYLFLIVIFFSGCKTTSILLKEKYTDPQVLSVQDLTPEEFQWTPITISESNKNDNQLLSFTQYEVKATNAKWACVRIDLEAPWQIIAEPIPQNLSKRFFLSDFAKKYKTDVAVNTVPFTSKNHKYLPVSVVKIDGNTICPLNESYSALAFKKIQKSDLDSSQTDENANQPYVWRAKIIQHQNEEDLQNYDYAFGGFFMILDEPTIYQFQKYKRSRTAAGLSSDGRYLYLMATCGINCPTGRNGLNFEECALILQKMGCKTAMQFDGGHSSGLTLKNKNLIKPSLQRKVPAAFGLKLP